MTPHEFLQQFGTLAESPQGVAKLRELILELAVRGKLVEQDEADEPAHPLLKTLRQQKTQLVKEKTIPKPVPVEEVGGDEPYVIPESWQWERLGNVSYFIEAGWSPMCEAHPRSGDNWGVLKISAVTWGTFNPDENKALPGNLEPRPQCEVKTGDFLMSRANTSELVAKSVVVNETP